MYDPAIGRWHVIDAMAEAHTETNPYHYCFNNPILFVDPLGLDTAIYYFDQANRPQDNGTAGTSYTADIVIIDDEDGSVIEIFWGSGSTYDNSKSNSNNESKWKTINEGTFDYSNKFGHSKGSKKGLNIGVDGVDTPEDRIVPATKNGKQTTLDGGNMHEGASNNGNASSRGSHGCLTHDPAIDNSYMNLFDWSGSYNGYTGNTGNSKGSVGIYRGAPHKSEQNNGKNDLSEMWYFRPKPYTAVQDNTRLVK